LVLRPSGPLEEFSWPEELEARVVTPGDNPRLHGYVVEEDLANHYTFVETVLLSLTGELPSRDQGRAFELALVFLSPLSVAEAPTHAALLARICGARSSAVVGITALALVERARHLLDEYALVVAWLVDPARSFPAHFRAKTAAERASVARLSAALKASAVELNVFGWDPDRISAVLALLCYAGLTRREQMEAVLLLASLAPSLGEAFTREVAWFHEYPTQLPLFEYEEAERGY
jgi:hypothetical protein